MPDSSVVTNNGKQLVGQRLDGTSSDYVQYIGWTDNNAAVAATDTALTGEDSDPRLPPQITYYTAGTNKQSFVFTLSASAGNSPGTINKIGLFTAVTSGTMFSETLLGSAITKNSGKEVQIQVDVEIT